MLLELQREKPTTSGAVLGKLNIDGAFFGHTLENQEYIFPDGKYNLWARTSPTFKTEKLYIDVPGRSNIMFHGGNQKEQSKGCVLVAANREGENISGDLSNKLFQIVDNVAKAGAAVGLKVTTPAKTWAKVAALILGAGAIYFIYRLNKKG